MKLGIIGLPQSGKTTLFNTLTQGNAPTGISGGKLSLHTAVIDVLDARVDALVKLFRPKKTVYAKVTYVDIGGLDGESARSGISGPLLNTLSQMDGFIHVIRQFENPLVPHSAGSVDPLRDLATMESEFMLHDLIQIERKLIRLEEERQRGGYGRDRAEIGREQALFIRLNETLSQGLPLRGETFSPEEEKKLSGHGLLSRIPQLVVVNQSEGQALINLDAFNSFTKPICMPIKLEMEIAQLSLEDATLFMKEYGIQEPSRNRLVRSSYELLDLLSFFTVEEEKEAHVWTIKRGSTALEAAGKIHSDMEKGFIRAEVIDVDELVRLGGFTEARQAGKLRLEGKGYLVQDGDVITVRFNL